MNHYAHTRKPNTVLIVLGIVGILIVGAVMVFFATGGAAEWREDFTQQHLQPSLEMSESLAPQIDERITTHVTEAGARLDEYVEQSREAFGGINE